MMRVLAFFLLMLGVSLAQTTHPIAASAVDLQAKIDDPTVIDGDTIEIAAGIMTDWTIEIVVDKAITIAGAGAGVTMIDKVVGLSEDPFIWLTTGGEVHRLTNITFAADSSSPQDGNKERVSFEGGGNPRSIVIIDNCIWPSLYPSFDEKDARGPLGFQKGAFKGVIYDCEFHDQDAIYFRMENWGGGTNGDGSWEEIVDWDSDEFIFIESNLFSNPNTSSNNTYGVTDGNGGSRVIVRYNTCFNRHSLFHGNDTSNKQRSGRALGVYHNNWTIAGRTQLSLGTDRGGTMRVFNNTITHGSGGQYSDTVNMHHYRGDNGEYKLWNGADGVIAWDTPDLTDGAGTPGGAGDGVFESGTTTGGGQSFLDDSTKSWTTNQWADYTLRAAIPYTATSGGTNTLTVAGAGWTPNTNSETNGTPFGWRGWIVTRVSDGKRSQVASNTTDTLTLIGSPYNNLSFAGGGAFVLSRSQVIDSNDADTLTLQAAGGTAAGHMTPDGLPYSYTAGWTYEIRKVDYALDCPGRGVSQPWTGTRGDVQNLGQDGTDPTLVFGNTYTTTGLQTVKVVNYYIQEDREYYQEKGSFDGSSGIGVGTNAARMAITPVNGSGVLFWATDVGEWNSANGATPDGQLYRESAGAWVLEMTPLDYPHPLRGAEAADTDPPAPDPAQFAVVPVATGPSSISFTVVTATDVSSVLYDYRLDGGAAQGGQGNPVFSVTSLTASTQYAVEARARDIHGNATAWSSVELVTTGPAPSVEPGVTANLIITGTLNANQ